MKLDVLYLVNQKRLKELLAAEAELHALKKGIVEHYTYHSVDTWEWYDASIYNYLDNYFEEHKDIIHTWDDDDPRKEDFDFDALASIEIQNDEFKKIDLNI